MAHIEFTDNYQDLSTESGYQFKFFCESCGNGYMSSWKASKAGIADRAAARRRQHARRHLGTRGNTRRQICATRRRARRTTTPSQEAVAEIRPLFVQCKRCGQWVCREICWNAERGLCTECAPILQREMAAKQAEIAVEQADEKLREQDLTEGVNFDRQAVVICPTCGAETEGGKFCPECGASLAPKTECPQCGAKFKPGAKFCPECGNKMV